MQMKRYNRSGVDASQVVAFVIAPTLIIADSRESVVTGQGSNSSGAWKNTSGEKKTPRNKSIRTYNTCASMYVSYDV